ncbi:hypothetical protein EXIGLDRAFT_837898 [Exidia glandulosa HHB12029]|uniref:NAD(P)-binding protein n=1 Tax=Exidia glandulosa HHB12029 TaxID=1314781 RepID=A0A165GC41_EXIGL|nr:hypothetical protein EXIGLDRAFT_837898 [Exidia glandulosa HHB12029]
MPTWLVTGTSRGIGLELVKHLAADSGNTVFASCRKPDTASTLNELAKSYTNLHVVTLDVDDESSAHMGGAGAEYEIDDAVTRHLKIFEAATLETHTNKFINQFGEEVPWPPVHGNT